MRCEGGGERDEGEVRKEKEAGKEDGGHKLGKRWRRMVGKV